MAFMVGVALRRVCAAVVVAALALINVAPCFCAPPDAAARYCGVKAPSSAASHDCCSEMPEPPQVAGTHAPCCCAGSEPTPLVADTAIPASAPAFWAVVPGVHARSAGLQLLAPARVRPVAPQSPPLILRI